MGMYTEFGILYSKHLQTKLILYIQMMRDATNKLENLNKKTDEIKKKEEEKVNEHSLSNRNFGNILTRVNEPS